MSQGEPKDPFSLAGFLVRRRDELFRNGEAREEEEILDFIERFLVPHARSWRDKIAKEFGAEGADDCSRKLLDDKRLWLKDPVVVDGAMHLWVFLQTRPKPEENAVNGDEDTDAEQEALAGESGQMSESQSPLESIAARLETKPDGRDRNEEAARWIQTTATHEMEAWLGAGDRSLMLRENIRIALSKARNCGLLRLHESSTTREEFYFPSGENIQPNPDLDLESLAKRIGEYTATGSKAACKTGVPSPLNDIVPRLLEAMRLSQAALSTSQMRDLLKRVFGIVAGKPQKKPIDEEPVGHKKVDLASQVEMDAKEGARTQEPFDLPGEHEPEYVIEEIMRKIIAKIEEKDGCSIDPPSDDLNRGTLGRLFLDYFIWRGWRLRDRPKLYTQTEFARRSGASVKTVNTRIYEQLGPCLRPEEELTAFDRERVRWKLCRKYRHRLPEFVDNERFNKGSETDYR